MLVVSHWKQTFISGLKAACGHTPLQILRRSNVQLSFRNLSTSPQLGYNTHSPAIHAAAHATMAQTIEQLTSTLKKFGISEVRSFPNAYPAYNPVDVYRAHITELLQPITGADPAVIYPAIQWTQTLDKGDVVLPVPALRLKGKKPDEIAKAIESQVRANEH